MVDTGTVTALQERKKLQQVLYERPRTVMFQWVKGGKPLHFSFFMNVDFGPVLLAGEILSFESWFQHFNHNTVALE